jgi:hypothetical protein
MKTWFTPAEILPFAADPLPSAMASLQEYILRQGWRADRKRARVRFGQGGGYEYHISLLPLAVRSALTAVPGDVELAGNPDAPQSPLWQAFERLPEASKGKALHRLSVVQTVLASGDGVTRQSAVASAASTHGVAASSVWNWLARIEGISRSDWLPALADQRAGGGKAADIPTDAWDYFLADKLRPEDPALTACYERTKRAAKVHGWGDLPSLKTFERRYKKEIPNAVAVYATKGREAASRLMPSQRRDRTVFASLEAVNADGYRHNVFIRWPDGTIGRPITVAFQDLRSGLWLAHRRDKSENKEVVRLAIADMIARHGIPEHCYFDNGKHFASKWLTGRMAFRFRFKVKDEEPQGILTALGVQVHFTTPYRGQSKPIERSFREIGEYIDKHPLFAGAYTGHNPLAKPENYGSTAVPLDVFESVVASEVEAHNAREGRRGYGMNGRSFVQVFAAHAPDIGFRRASIEQRRLFLLAAEGVVARKPSGHIELFENRFWAEPLAGMIGKKLIVRFDPQALGDGVAVYTLDNRFIAHAARLDDIGFNSVDDAREAARIQSRLQRNLREQRDLHVRFDEADLKRLTPVDPATVEPVPARVQRLVAGGSRAPALDFDALSIAATALDGTVIPLRPRK